MHTNAYIIYYALYYDNVSFKFKYKHNQVTIKFNMVYIYKVLYYTILYKII